MNDLHKVVGTKHCKYSKTKVHL